MIYKVICNKCHKTRSISYRPKKINLCRSCSNIESQKIIKNKNKTKKNKVYICPTCPSIRIGYKRKTPYCITCSRKIIKNKIKYYFDLNEMKTIKVDNYKKRKKQSKTYVPVGFDGKQKVIIKEKIKPKRALKNEKEMIKEYLSKNKVTIIQPLTKTI